MHLQRNDMESAPTAQLHYVAVLQSKTSRECNGKLLDSIGFPDLQLQYETIKKKDEGHESRQVATEESTTCVLNDG